MLDYLYAPVLQALIEGRLAAEFDSQEITRRAWVAWGFGLGTGRWEFMRMTDLLLLLAAEVRLHKVFSERQLDLFDDKRAIP